MKGSISFRKGKQVWWRNEIEKSSRRISGEFWQPQSPPLPRTTMRWDKSAGWIPGAPVGCRQIRWASLTFIIFSIETTDTKKIIDKMKCSCLVEMKRHEFLSIY